MISQQSTTAIHLSNPAQHAQLRIRPRLLTKKKEGLLVARLQGTVSSVQFSSLSFCVQVSQGSAMNWGATSPMCAALPRPGPSVKPSPCGTEQDVAQALLAHTITTDEMTGNKNWQNPGYTNRTSGRHSLSLSYGRCATV